MALTQSDLSDLLAALKAGEMTDTIRTSLEWILQELIESEASAVIGALPTSAVIPAPPSATDTAPGCCRPQPATSSSRSKLRQGSFFPSLLEEVSLAVTG